MAYKAINTLDSMIGHTDERYFYFGKVAARLDDVANFLPSRLTALGIAAAAAVIDGASSKAALYTWLSDGMKHKSPNAGQPESAMAGAVGVRLGGENFYDGELVASPLIGERFTRPSTHETKQAIRIVAAVSALGAIAALLLRRKKDERSSPTFCRRCMAGNFDRSRRVMEFRADHLLDFSANINPAGPPRSVLAAIQRALEDPATLGVYPDLELVELKKTIARLCGCAARKYRGCEWLCTIA